MSILFSRVCRKRAAGSLSEWVLNLIHDIFCFMIPAVVLIVLNCSSYDVNKKQIPKRIVSLAPSITETLFAMGLGDRVVGVTTYCVYPPEAKKIEKIGSYTDINFEKVMLIKPDLIIMQQEHERAQQFFQRYNLQTLTVDYVSIASMCTTFARIGALCGVPLKADSLIKTLHVLDTSTVLNESRPKVLLCVGRNTPGSGDLSGVFLAGVTTFYNDLIQAAGGRNVVENKLPHYPQLSKEGIVSLSPDIIIDIAPSMSGSSCSTLVDDWKVLPVIPAVKNSEVYCLANDYSTLPGPRAGLLLNDFKGFIEPFITRQRN